MSTMYEFREVPGAGTATFATQDIERGTTLMHETPLTTTKVGMHQYSANFFNQYLKRSDEDKASFEELFSAEELVEGARKYIRGRMGPEPMKGTTEWAEWNRTLNHNAKVASIHSNNCWTIERDPEYLTAVYKNQSRLNHSCSHNATSVIQKDKSQKMETTRNIKAGEELTCSYIDVGNDYEERQIALINYSFTCTCPLCAMEKYIDETKDVELDIFGRRLVQSDLQIMVEFFRSWFACVHDEEDTSRTSWAKQKWAAERSYVLRESVPFSEIALEILKQIAAETPTQNANNNVEYWSHVMEDLQETYGNSSDWLKEINALDPRTAGW